MMKRYLAPFAVAALLIVAFLASSSRSASATSEYNVMDLGVLGNCNGCNSLSSARAINASGMIVGEATTANAQTHGFLWQNGVMQDLGTLPGGSGSSAWGINTGGGVVGRSNGSAFGNHAFLWQNGTMQDLGSLGGNGSEGHGINDIGQIVGSSSTTNGVIHAFVWQNGVFNDIAAVQGFSNCNSSAKDINNLGQVVGTGCNAFLWTQVGGKQELGTLPGGAQSWANAINDQVQIAGESTINTAGTRHAFLWQNGAMQDLGTLSGATSSRAWAINNLGDVAGEGTLAGLGHALLWRDGAVLDLNALLPSGSGWDLQVAYGINDNGQIVGEGVHNGARRAFLLMPSAPVATSTPSATSTSPATNTASPEPPTFTLTPTSTETEVPNTATSSPTSTASFTASPTATSSPTSTIAVIETATPTDTATSIATVSVTSTRTPALSPTVCSQPNPIQNGGFEQGLTSWAGDQGPPWPDVRSGGHSGNYAATVGTFPGDYVFSGNRFSTLYQQFQLPPAGGTLSFWYQLHKSDQASGRQRIYLANTQGQPGPILLQQLSNTQAWQEISYTIGPSSGGAIRLYFEAFQHNGGTFGYETVGIKFDDVTFIPACGSPTGTAIPSHTAGPSGTPTPTASPTPDTCGSCHISIVWLDGGCAQDQRFHWSALVANSGVCSIPNYQFTLQLESRSEDGRLRVESVQTITTTLAPGNNVLQGELCTLRPGPFGPHAEMRVRMELDRRYWPCYQSRTSVFASACSRSSCP